MIVDNGKLTFNIDIKDIPSVHRLITAIGNITETRQDGTHCTCGRQTEHVPCCIELSEAYKEIKE